MARIFKSYPIFQLRVAEDRERKFDVLKCGNYTVQLGPHSESWAHRSQGWLKETIEVYGFTQADSNLARYPAGDLKAFADATLSVKSLGPWPARSSLGHDVSQANVATSSRNTLRTWLRWRGLRPTTEEFQSKGSKYTLSLSWRRKRQLGTSESDPVTVAPSAYSERVYPTCSGN